QKPAGLLSLGEGVSMDAICLVSILVLWAVVLFLSFLLLGTLQAQARLRWRLEQLEATTPRPLGRDGLPRGETAPHFTLPSTEGPEVSLHDFAGSKVLLVFTQSTCGPCHQIMPELNNFQANGKVQVVVVNNGDLVATRQWAAKVRARFPLLVQEQFRVSKKYEVFATPFAFLIDEQGVIASKGIINNKQHIGFVLSGPREGARNEHADGEPAEAEGEIAEVPVSNSTVVKEVGHV